MSRLVCHTSVSKGAKSRFTCTPKTGVFSEVPKFCQTLLVDPPISLYRTGTDEENDPWDRVSGVTRPVDSE